MQVSLRFLLRLVPLVLLATAPQATASQETDVPGAAPTRFSTEGYLELAPIFQVSVVTGALEILEHWMEMKGDDDRACFQRWSSPEDVMVILAHYVRLHPATLRQPFSETLIASLGGRCGFELSGH